MCAGAGSIVDLVIARSDGMQTLSDGDDAPSTIGMLSREFTLAYANQPESVLRERLGALCERGHTALAGKQILRKELSPPITTLGAEHRSRETESGKGVAARSPLPRANRSVRQPL